MRDRGRERDEYGEPRERRGGNKALVIGALVVLLLAALGGVAWYFFGGETTAEVIAKYRPRFADQRAKLKRIAASLPAPGSVQDEKLPANFAIDPKPMYDEPNKTFNTAILMAEHCEDPDRQLKTPTEFDLLFHEDEFRTHLLWTGDRNPMAESARRSRAKDLAKRFERSLELRYLVVVRAMWFDPLRVKEDTFTGGDLDLEVFVVDYRAEKVQGAFVRRYRPDRQVMVTFRKDRKQNESAEEFIYSNVWSKAREDVAGTLVFGTRGLFDIGPAKR